MSAAAVNAPHLQPDEGAPRRALDSDTDANALGIASMLRELGIAVTGSHFTPGGAAILLHVGDAARWLTPREALALRIALEQAAGRAL